MAAVLAAVLFPENRLTGVGSLLKGYPLFICLWTEGKEDLRMDQELNRRVKRDVIKSLVLAVLSLAISAGLFYLLW